MINEINNKEKLINWFVQHYNGNLSAKGYENLDINVVNDMIRPMKDEYLEFILNNIARGKDCTIYGRNAAGSISHNYSRAFKLIYASININLKADGRSFYHEFGHYLDMYLNDNVAAWHSTSTILPSFGCTLLDVLKGEIKVQADTIYNEYFPLYEKQFDKLTYEGGYKEFLEDQKLYRVKSALCKEINKAIPDEAGLNNMNTYASLTKEIVEKAPKEILTKIYQYFDIIEYLYAKEKVRFRGAQFKPEFDELIRKYDVVIDALGFVKDLRDENWGAHSKSYYKRDRDHLAVEFFANMFSADIIGLQETLAICKRLLPKSCAAYYELMECMKETYKN